MGKFPFRFYGANPADWFEGALCGHVWEVQFRADLEADARLKLAKAMQTAAPSYDAIQTTCAHIRTSLFSGPWMRITMGEIEGDDPDGDRFWQDVQGFWRAIHQTMPIEEVRFCGVREPDETDAWSQWSVAEKALPGPAPAWPVGDRDVDVYGHGMERFEAEAEEDPAFEQARQPAQSEKPAAATTVHLALVPAPVKLALEPEPYQVKAQKAAHKTIWSRPIGHGRFFALLQKGPAYAPVVVDAEGTHDLDIGTAPGWMYEVTSDQNTLLLARGGEMFRVPLDTRKVETLPVQEGEVGGMADLGNLFVVEQKVGRDVFIDLLEKKGKKWQRSARVRGKALDFIGGVAGHKLLVLTVKGKKAKQPSLYLTVAPDGLRLLGTSAFPVRKILQKNDRVIVLSRKGDAMLEEFQTDGKKLQLVTKKCDLFYVENLEASVEHARSTEEVVADLRKVGKAVPCIDA